MKHKAFLFRVFIVSLLLITAGLLPATPVRAAGILYAKPSGAGDCSTWAKACDLQKAISNAASGDEIWVAKGIHTPGVQRINTFQIKNGVKLYGGFAGAETAREQRDITINPTVLSGDLADDDTTNSQGVVIDVEGIDPDDNAYNVVTAIDVDKTALLDGFTITAGYAQVSAHSFGGGMYNLSSSPTLANITFSGNVAELGGGMHNDNSNPTLTQVDFRYNYAGEAGGGMSNLSNSKPVLVDVAFNSNSGSDVVWGGGMYNWESSPQLTEVSFYFNEASLGGGMYNNTNSSPSLIDCYISDNDADAGGGGMYNLDGSNPTLTNVTVGNNSAAYGGGIYNRNGSNPTLTNVTFRDNSSAGGGGIYNYSSSPSLINVTIARNGASVSGGGGIYNRDSSNPTLTNVTFYNNTSSSPSQMRNDEDSHPLVYNTLFSGAGTDCSGTFAAGSESNLSDDTSCTGEATANLLPGNLADWGGRTYTLSLLDGSAAIGAGNNEFCPETDQRGGERDYACDVGAFERNAHLIFYVKPDSGYASCTDWDHACSLLDALSTATTGAEIWVTAGVHTPALSKPTTSDSFHIKSGVKLYGGFAGSETERSQRDFAANVTVLSGDLTRDDETDANGVVTDAEDINNPTRNSYHVITPDGAGETTLLDGFTITAGYAVALDGNTDNDHGGGIFCNACSLTLKNITFSGNRAVSGGGIYVAANSNLTLNDVIFSGNLAADDENNSIGDGGGLYTTQSTLALTKAIFHDNTASGNGGGMANVMGSPTLTNVTFSANSADTGGGLYNAIGGSTILKGVTFAGNSASDTGGGMSNCVNSNPKLTNVTFSGNKANDGGAMLNDSGSSPILTNVTFSGNAASAGASAGAIKNINGSQPKVYNTLFVWGTTGINCSGDFAADSDSNLSNDDTCGTSAPLTSNLLLGTLGDWGGDTQTVPLLGGSAAINAGNNDVCPDADQRGVTRDDLCDVGAFETVSLPPVASDDGYTIAMGAALTVPAVQGVLANDTDADDEALTAELVTNVSTGTLVFEEDGSFTYTAPPNYTGEVIFTYRASDGTNYSNDAQVTILVQNSGYIICLPLIHRNLAATGR